MKCATHVRSNAWIERPDLTGPRPWQEPSPAWLTPAASPDWSKTWSEVFRTTLFWEEPRNIAFWQTVPMSFAVVCETLPIVALSGSSTENPSDTTFYLSAIETAFGDSASDLAKMLRVSRPMIYHYRGGMEPSLENYRRIKLIGTLAGEQTDLTAPLLRDALKLPQPEGRSLLELLSEENLDVPVVRRILRRTSEDLARRHRLAAALANTDDRGDIMRDRHAAGKPIYISDPDAPGKIIQIRPDKSRVRGRMVNRKFIPDEG
jgi:hypothetical protein